MQSLDQFPFFRPGVFRMLDMLGGLLSLDHRDRLHRVLRARQQFFNILSLAHVFVITVAHDRTFLLVDGEEDTPMLFLQHLKMPNLQVGQLMKHIAANAGRLAAVTDEQTVERRSPIQSSDLFGYAVGSQ